MRVASLEYLNFDSHDRQNEELTANFSDLFGRNKGLHSLYDALPADARNNMVMVLAGEFGRQIRANLSGGTYLSWNGTDGTMDGIYDASFLECPNAMWDGSTTSFMR